jgi:hypothetical protein
MFALSLRMARAKGRSGAIVWALCAVAAAATSGCSFLFVDGPPPNAQKLQTFSCTTSNTLPTTDVVIGGITLLEGLGALTQTSSSFTTSSGSNSSNYIGAGVVLAGAALFGVSAATGYKNTSACREATSELMTRLYRNAPGGAPPGGFAPYLPTAPPQPYDPWTAPPPAAAPPPAVAPRPGAPQPPGAAPPAAGSQTWDGPPPAAPSPAPAVPPGQAGGVAE